MRRPHPRVLGAVPVLAAALLLGSCGKTSQQSAGGGPLRRLAPVEAQGAVSVTTRNTSRVGGANAVVDAAAVARVAYPGLTPSSRPQAVVLVNDRDWPAALASAELAGAPLGAPLLYAEGDGLPAVSSQALAAMHPTGASALGGASVVEIGTTAALPAGSGQATSIPAASGPSVAGALEGVLARAEGAPPRRVIVVDLQEPLAEQMPAAGLAAESGAPILFVSGPTLPAPTYAVLRSLRRPSIYLLGAAAMSPRTLGSLARLGSVTRISTGTEGAAANSIAVARFTDDSFGWGVKEPGHGLVFANASRPLDAPAAAPLSATGDYAPLLLLQAPGTIPPALAAYLGDIRPGYSSAPEFSPAKGVYNRGWLIGDERAISLTAQAELDSLLEIGPSKGSGSEEAPAAGTE